MTNTQPALSEMLPAERAGTLPAIDKGWRIVVLDRGWVFVGQVFDHESYLEIREAACIRKWGTERGIGQLVTGPTKETVLDPAGIVEAPARAVIFTLECVAEGWG